MKVSSLINHLPLCKYISTRLPTCNSNACIPYLLRYKIEPLFPLKAGHDWIDGILPKPVVVLNSTISKSQDLLHPPFKSIKADRDRKIV